MNNNPDNTGEIQATRDKSGRFIEGISGNIKGKPPGSKNYLTLLERALKEYETEKGKSLFKRLAERAFISDQVMLSIVKKFIPDLKALEIKDSGQDQLRMIIMSRGYSEKEQDFIDEHIVEWRKQTGLPFIIKDDPDNKLTEEEKLILKRKKKKSLKKLKKTLKIKNLNFYNAIQGLRNIF